MPLVYIGKRSELSEDVHGELVNIEIGIPYGWFISGLVYFRVNVANIWHDSDNC